MAKDVPTVKLFPSYVGMPIVFWPRGQRLGDCKPGVIQQNDNEYMVNLFEFREGENVRYGGVRHVDDAYFTDHPKARASGAWDYCDGVAYAFFIPGKLQLPDDFPFTMEIARQVLHLTNLRWPIGQIAGTLRVTGLTVEKISEILKLAA